MKIKVLPIVLCLITASSKAQVYLGINAGANLGSIVTKIDGKKDDGIKAATGYSICGDVNIPLKNNLLLQTGVQFESIHSKVNTENSTSGSGYTYKETFTSKAYLNSVNIPLKLFYAMPVGKGSFRFGAGPFMGIGVGGKSKSTDITETTIGSTTTRNVYENTDKAVFGSADTTIKRVSFGAGLNVGYITASNFCVAAYANFGLSNINNQDKYNSKTYSYGITVGYVFRKKDEK